MPAKTKPLTDCNCSQCVGACESQPGMFAPGEVAKAAALLGMEPRDFFKQHVVVDYINDDDGTMVFYLAPVKSAHQQHHTHRNIAMAFYPAMLGACVFLRSKRCHIHQAKPAECRDANPCAKDWTSQRPRLVALWREHQSEIDTYLASLDERRLEL